MSERDPTPEPVQMGFEPEDKTLTPWRDVKTGLTAAQTYWLATARPDGRPHVMPVWGVWLDGAFYFSTSATSRKGRNLAANPSCTITVSLDGIDVVVEGAAAILDDESMLRRVADVYGPKYDWPLTVRDGGIYGENGDGGPIYKLSPAVAFGFEAEGTFAATRWRF
jgi:hypothetical protein